jgi:CDP-diacylglycerol--glycerol-3-phosphate 3-phosphatidyltransferase
MSLANKISLGRILLVPCIVASLVYYSPTRDGLRYVALALFVLGILSDAVDGFVARSQRQQSPLGTILDPIADKFLILGTLISLSTIRGLPSWMRIPAWFNLIVISRDALLVIGTMLLFAFTGKVTIQPNRLGKWTVVAQMLVVPAVLLDLPWTLALLIIAATMTALSAMSYVRLGAKLLESR